MVAARSGLEAQKERPASSLSDARQSTRDDVQARLCRLQDRVMALQILRGDRPVDLLETLLAGAAALLRAELDDEG